MDSSRFDALTRTLARTRTRRSVTRGLAAGAAALIGGRFGRAAAAPQDKVTICHFTGSSTNPYNIISVSGNALSTHQSEHGDFVFTDCCLDSECTAFANSFCDSGTCSCSPATCADLGVVCGEWDDGCGGVAQGCSACEEFANSFCDDDGQCSCAAATCADLGVACGEWDDGCGGIATGCAACTAFPNSFCDDDGQCSCDVDTCSDLAVECGEWSDGCGGIATGCAACTEFPNSFCDPNGQCGCDALTQAEACAGDFGTVSDGCGATYYCGCANAVISSSPTDATAPVDRDDDVRVQVNGFTAYQEANGFSGPAELIPVGPVRNGDAINVVAWDPRFGDRWLISPLYLHCPADGRSQTLDSAGFFQDVADFQDAPLPNGFYNRDFTVAL